MKYQTLENKKVVSENINTPNFDRTCDVVIVGLGTAGSFAAIQAGREGLSVIGIDPLTYMGGVGTGGSITSYYHGTHGGLQTEIDDKVKSYQENYTKDGVSGWHACAKKHVLEDEAVKAGVSICYRSIVLGVYVENLTVMGCKVLTPDGIMNIKALTTIDASGDAHCAAMTGCAFKYGRESDGQAQPYSFPKYVKHSKGHYRGVNFDAGIVDPRDGESLSKAACFSQTLHLEEKYDEDVKLINVSSHIGLREGRFIVGEENITFEDLMFSRTFEQPLLPTYANYDLHSKDLCLESHQAQLWVIVCNYWQKKVITEIPMGALIPKGWNGILVIGRCIAVDHDSSQTIRMQRDMQKVGEASGMMAAIAKKHQCSLKHLPYAELKESLVQSGCYYNFKENQTKKEEIQCPEDLHEILSSENPSDGLWFASNAPESYDSHLEKWLMGSSQECARNSAIALALRGSDKGLEILHSIINERDPFIPVNSYKLKYPRCLSAIYSCGQLASEQSFHVIKGILNNPKEDLQARSFAYVALAKISKVHPGLSDECRSLFKDFESLENDKMIIPLHGHGSTRPQDTEYDFKTRLKGGVRL